LDDFYYIGIDPGVSGGLAVLTPDGDVELATKFPDNEGDIFRTLSLFSVCSFAVLELVRSSPQMGVRSAFTFGQSYGALRMALAAAYIPFAEITPSKWQLAMKCRSKGDKNVTKRRAVELFPAVKVTHAISDALLLAYYCRRMKMGLSL